MSNGAKAIAFAGATNVSNTTGVPAVIWKNAYATNWHKQVLICKCCYR